MPRWKPEQSTGPCARWFCSLAQEALEDGDTDMATWLVESWDRAEKRVAKGKRPRDPVERVAEIALELIRQRRSA